MKKKYCYFCGKEATTKEHIPPRQMFKGFKCDSITVPSCEIHNCSKGGDDQAIVNALLIPFKNQIKLKRGKKLPFNNDIIKAISFADSSFERTKYRVISKHFIKNLPDSIKDLAEVSFLKPPIRIKNWIINLTAGLIFDCIQEFDSSINWEKIECWSPDWLKYQLDLKEDEAQSMLQLKFNLRNWLNDNNWIPGWSATPRKYPPHIYHFHLCIDKSEIIFRHIFYDNYTWYVWLNKTSRITEGIKTKLSI